MDRRAIAGLVLCLLVYLGYEYYMKTKYADYYQAEAERRRQEKTSETTAPTSAGTAPAAGEAPSQPPAEMQRLSPEELTIETDTSIYRFSQDNGSLESVHLKNYRATSAKDSGPVNVVDSPLALQGVLDANRTQPVTGVFSAQREGRTIRFARDEAGFHIVQEFTVPEQGYGTQVRVHFTNNGAGAMDVTAGLLANESLRHKKAPSLIGFIPGGVPEVTSVVYRTDGSTEHRDAKKFCGSDEPIAGTSQPLELLGFDKHYFIGVILPKAKTSSFRFTHGADTADSCPATLVTYDRQGILQPGQTLTLEYDAYFGPKDTGIMKAYAPALESTVHGGMFSFIGRPLLAVIEGFHSVTGNWGVSLILLTILLKILFFPLMKASATSAHRMKKLNPQMAALKERYKDDPRRQQQELMKFMSQHQINPMKGCLPILPTIPVFLAFYQVLQTSIQLRHAPFFGWIQDLSAMDPFFVTPLLMTAAMWGQQKLTPPTGMDKTQEKILMFMPLMFGAMMATLPAGLTLYTLTNTVVSIVQQKWLYTKLEKQQAAA